MNTKKRQHLFRFFALFFALLTALCGCAGGNEQGEASAPTEALATEALATEATVTTPPETETASTEPPQPLVTPEPMEVESVLISVPFGFFGNTSEVYDLPAGWDWESPSNWNEVEITEAFHHRMAFVNKNGSKRYNLASAVRDWGTFGSYGVYILSSNTRCLFVADENGSRVIDLPKQFEPSGFGLAANVNGVWFLLVGAPADNTVRHQLVKLGDDGSVAEIWNCTPTRELDYEAVEMHGGDDGLLHMTVYGYNEQPPKYHYYVFENGVFSETGSEPEAELQPPEVTSGAENCSMALSKMLYENENGCVAAYAESCSTHTADGEQIKYNYYYILSLDSKGSIVAGMDNFDYLNSMITAKGYVLGCVKAVSSDSVLILGLYENEVRIQKVMLKQGFSPDYPTKHISSKFTMGQLIEMGIIDSNGNPA